MDPKEKILNRLLALWRKNPDLRLGQLVANNDTVYVGLYYIKDDSLVAQLEEYYGKLKISSSPLDEKEKKLLKELEDEP